MILEVDDLRFAYNGRPVLDGVSFCLAPGRMLGVLGVNGAGKSTLLKCLDRILAPRGGTVRLDGRDLATLDDDARARELGYVPQEGDRQELSVFEAVLLGRRPHLRWRAGRRDLEAAEAALAALGLTRLALRPLASLSGGEAQKVLIARALAQEPRVLLLDEPTSSLDLRNQLEVMALLSAAVRRRGLSAVLCLHDLNLALAHLDQLMLMRDGLVHALIPPAGLTPELVRQVYGVEVEIVAAAGRRVVVPRLPPQKGEEEAA